MEKIVGREENKFDINKIQKYFDAVKKSILISVSVLVGSGSVEAEGNTYTYDEFKELMSRFESNNEIELQKVYRATGIDFRNYCEQHNLKIKLNEENKDGRYIIFIPQVHETDTTKSKTIEDLIDKNQEKNKEILKDLISRDILGGNGVVFEGMQDDEILDQLKETNKLIYKIDSIQQFSNMFQEFYKSGMLSFVTESMISKAKEFINDNNTNDQTKNALSEIINLIEQTRDENPLGNYAAINLLGSEVDVIPSTNSKLVQHGNTYTFNEEREDLALEYSKKQMGERGQKIVPLVYGVMHDFNNNAENKRLGLITIYDPNLIQEMTENIEERYNNTLKRR